MLRSMTGYGSAEASGENYLVKAEIKSLNGKFFDLNLRLPKLFADKEITVRNHINTRLVRGTVSAYISIEKQKAGKEEAVKLDTELVTQYYKSWKSLADTLGADDRNILPGLMQLPDLLKSDQGYEEKDWQLILSTLEEALEQLIHFRTSEGNDLQKILRDHCRAIEQMIPEVEVLEPERMEITRNRLGKNLEDLMGKEGFDKNRFEQELIYYLEKLDISEEKNRLRLHCGHFSETLEEDDCGRKLNFIAQEIGREINTLGAKANHAGLQKVVVRMKEELEKIKEQVLNVL